MTTKLRMEMRVGETRPVAVFALREGETLDERVKKELEIAARDGNLGDHSASPTVPCIQIMEVDGNDNKIDGAVHLFTLKGEDVTRREGLVTIENDGDGTYILVEGVKEDAEGNEAKEKLGVFFNEDVARRVAALWKAGALD